MSVLDIRLDECEYYGRAVIQLYTCLSRGKLVEYIGTLELLAADRQETFFKIDVDVEKPPTELRADGWSILTITMKSRQPQPIMLFRNLFCELFPHRMRIDNINKDTFTCSGGLTGGDLSENDFAVFKRLAQYQKVEQENVQKIAEEYFEKMKEQERDGLPREELIGTIIDMAVRYKIHGGRWLFFFPDTSDKGKYEKMFDYLLQCLCNDFVATAANRFNAKISNENLIVSFGNAFSIAATDREILSDSDAQHADNADDGPRDLRAALDRVYHPLLGPIVVRYKPEILSCCCIQRNTGTVRPTVYTRSYAKWYYEWLGTETRGARVTLPELARGDEANGTA